VVGEGLFADGWGEKKKKNVSVRCLARGKDAGLIRGRIIGCFPDRTWRGVGGRVEENLGFRHFTKKREGADVQRWGGLEVVRGGASGGMFQSQGPPDSPERIRGTEHLYKTRV